MTQSKEQERAEFEAWASNEFGYSSADFTQSGGRYILDHLYFGYQGWQASRRAQLVPKFSHVAKQKLDYLLEAGEEITGYAIQNKDGRRGAIDCHGFVYWWQDGAPLQLPEPFGWIDDGGLVYWRLGNPPADDTNIYTEHQVRQLLAAHGVK